MPLSGWTGYDSPSTLAAPSATLTDFTYFISLNELSATWWANVKSDGGDIRATKSDGSTELPCHLIAFNYGANTGLLAVKYSGNQTTSPDDIQIWCGNSGASLPAASDTYGSENAYASHWQAFFAQGGGNDATVNGNDLTMTGSPSVGGAAGPINGSEATTYNGTTQYGSAASSSVLSITGALTIVGSVSAGTQNYRSLCAKYNFNTNNRGYAVVTKETSSPADDIEWFYQRSASSYTGDDKILGTNGALNGTWKRFATRFTPSTEASIWIGGTQTDSDTTTVQSAIASNSATFQVAAQNGSTGLLSGLLALLAVHNAALSDAWLAYDGVMVDVADPDQSNMYGTWSWTAAASGSTYQKIIGALRQVS